MGDAPQRTSFSNTMVAGSKTVTVTASDWGVTEWVSRYVSPWWAVRNENGGAMTVSAVHDPAQYDSLATGVTVTAHAETPYPRARTLYTLGRDDAVLAVTPSHQVAYRYTVAAHRIEVVGRSPDVAVLARAAARVARELMRAQLVADGWAVLHASAVVIGGGRAVLTLGRKGAGKSTVAFAMAASGAGLVANDRVFARARRDGGGVELLAWPSGAAVGLGLMGALGWAGTARVRLTAGEAAHPSQDRRVTEALLAGRIQALRDGGRELKAHVRPEEFSDWYGIATSGYAQAGLVLFPRMTPEATPREDSDTKTDLVEEHFMLGAQEDSYPDIFGLTDGCGGGSAQSRADLTQAVSALPCRALVLSHEHGANTVFLSALAEAVA